MMVGSNNNIMAWAWIRLVILILVQPTRTNVFARAQDEVAALVGELPKTSTDFFAFHSCKSADELNILGNEDDSFFRWVLSALHAAWHPGWEVAMPAINDGMGEGEKQHARVFDLLNWSREQNLLPAAKDISSICHKGMGSQYLDGSSWTDDNAIPPMPNEHIPAETWTNLWNTCHKQLQSTTRISSACIDIPGIVVANPNPPLQVNNPCNLEYRMVDGAHRICLRKYVLALLAGELIDLEEKAAESKNNSQIYNMDKTQCQIKQKQRRIEETNRGSFLVLNQTTFQSMLMGSDPHKSWGKSKQFLTKDITKELQLEWRNWMGRVMGHVWENKRKQRSDDECSYLSINAAEL